MKSIWFRTEIRIYRTYIEPLLLYNSEIWSLTSTLEESLDAFHRRLLRITLNYVYPKKISNEKLYTLSEEVPLSQKIKRRRLNLFGHILRLDPETPAKKAIQYYLTPHLRPVGRPPTTWLSVVSKDLANTLNQHRIRTPINRRSLNRLEDLAKNRILWREEVMRSMRGNP